MLLTSRIEIPRRILRGSSIELKRTKKIPQSHLSLRFPYKNIRNFCNTLSLFQTGKSSFFILDIPPNFSFDENKGKQKLVCQVLRFFLKA
jgi:hypothetical protein